MNASSKNGNGFVDAIKSKIETLKKEAEDLLAQIKALDENDEIRGYLNHDELDSFFTDEIYRFSPLDLQEINIDEVLNDDDESESQ